VGVSEAEEVAARLVVVLVQKAREQDDGITRTFERHKNMGVTFTSGDENNMKARGSRGTSHSSMCADQAAALKSFLFLYPFNTQGIHADSKPEESVAQDVDAVVFVMVLDMLLPYTIKCHPQTSSKQATLYNQAVLTCHQHSQQKYHCSDSIQLQSLCLFVVDTGLWTPSMES
jgi:hypothetical protein